MSNSIGSVEKMLLASALLVYNEITDKHRGHSVFKQRKTLIEFKSKYIATCTQIFCEEQPMAFLENRTCKQL